MTAVKTNRWQTSEGAVSWGQVGRKTLWNGSLVITNIGNVTIAKYSHEKGRSGFPRARAAGVADSPCGLVTTEEVLPTAQLNLLGLLPATHGI
jgi:hypothetical protein